MVARSISMITPFLSFFSRLERNQERQKEASNMEYLKNVVLKVSQRLE